MQHDDDFTRHRDPDRQRKARLLALVVATAGVGLVALWLARHQAAPPVTAVPVATTSPPAPPSLSPTPAPAQPVLGPAFSAVYDPAAHQVVTFGGVDSFDQTWLWDGRHWRFARPAVSPPGRFRAAAAYDPLTHVVMLYGGRLGPGQLVDDTWAWDGTTWRELDAGGGKPPSGEGAVMAWDGATSQMVLVGGQTSDGATWTWNGSRWVRQPAAALPAATQFVGVAMDPVTGVLLGATCCSVGNGSTSTWAWNGSVWRQVVTRAQPLFTVGMASDPVSGRLLLFGDASIALGREMWSWSGSDWILLTGSRLPLFPTGAVTDTTAGDVVVLGSVAEPVLGNPQPVHLWSWTGRAWFQLG